MEGCRDWLEGLNVEDEVRGGEWGSNVDATPLQEEETKYVE